MERCCIRLVCHYLLSVSDTYILNYLRRPDYSRLHRFGYMHMIHLIAWRTTRPYKEYPVR